MAKEFIVETSARHIHVTKETLEILFGKGHELTPKKDLSQPGQFACEERVTIVGPKREMPGVSILGPCRKSDQLELAATDARSIGVTAPVRESGDLAGSAPCKVVGPCGEVEMKEGVIIAKRHIHMTPEDAAELDVKNGQIVDVLIENENGRRTIFGDTVVRVSPSYKLAMHIDTDESNAAMCAKNQMGTIVAKY
ncbi:MAG: phosphate propanoyltransferase [Clostridia bacterium]|nr:phosphate propanoyltransferase [Clostridia bacterium]